MITEQQAVQRLTLQGDFTIGGVNEQLSEVTRLLAGANALLTEYPDQRLLYEIDLSGVQALDTSGVQLLAVFFRTLRQHKVEEYSLQISDEYREKIHLLGFGDEIFIGERT